jgi:hypothetical protein
MVLEAQKIENRLKSSSVALPVSATFSMPPIRTTTVRDVAKMQRLSKAVREMLDAAS